MVQKITNKSFHETGDGKLIVTDIRIKSGVALFPNFPSNPFIEI